MIRKTPDIPAARGVQVGVGKSVPVNNTVYVLLGMLFQVQVETAGLVGYGNLPDGEVAKRTGHPLASISQSVEAIPG